MRRPRRIGELILTAMAYVSESVEDKHAPKGKPKQTTIAYRVNGSFTMLGDPGPFNYMAMAEGRYRLVLEETPARCQDVIVRPERKKKR